MRNKNAVTAKAAGLMLVLAGAANAGIIADPKTDWSDTSNPHSGWSYDGGGNASLLSTSAWDPGEMSGQSAWADPGVGTLPAWFLSTAVFNGFGASSADWQLGDIVTHTDGVGLGFDSVTWTSSVTGYIDVVGSLWNGRNIGRENGWRLRHSNGDVILASGQLTSGDGHGRSSPESFAVHSFFAHVGDVFTLELGPTSTTTGDFVGVSLTFSDAAAPEPSSVWLLAGGALAFAWTRRIVAGVTR